MDSTIEIASIANYDLKLIGEYIGYTISLIVGAVVGYKKIIKPLFQWISKKISGWYGTLNDKLDLLEKQFEGIKSELLPNGGSSLRDSINRIEQRQLSFEQKSRAVVDDISFGMFEANSEGKWLFANKYIRNLFNRSLFELTGDRWLSVVSKDDLDRVRQQWISIVKEQRIGQIDLMTVYGDEIVITAHPVIIGQSIDQYMIESVTVDQFKQISQQMIVGFVGNVKRKVDIADGEQLF